MDNYWRDAVTFLKSIDSGCEIFVPRDMMQYLEGAKDFSVAPASRSSKTVTCIHKGLISEINADLLFDSLIYGEFVYANEVFVIYSTVSSKTPIAKSAIHLGSMKDALSNLFKMPKQSSPIKFQDNRMATYLGNQNVLTTLRTGEKIYLDSADISLTPHIVQDGYWEEWITKAFLRSVTSGMHVVDVGANCGYFTLLACSAVGPSGTVTAIDANPRMTELLHNSITVNGFLDRAKVINAAVHEVEGTIDLAIPKRFKGSATTVTKGLDLSGYQDSFDLIKVRSATLDKLLTESLVDVIKIDAEGAEPFIFRGCESFFRSNKSLSVFMEFTPSFFVETISGEAFLDQIAGFGFEISLINHDGSTSASSRDRILSLPKCDLFLRKN